MVTKNGYQKSKLSSFIKVKKLFDITQPTYSICISLYQQNYFLFGL